MKTLAPGVLAQHEVLRLRQVPQPPDSHPEGDAYTHTILVCEAAEKIAQRDRLNDDDTRVLVLAALCHDLGKYTAFRYGGGKRVVYGHWVLSVAIAEHMLSHMGVDAATRRAVLALVREHHAYISWGSAQPTPKAVRKLAARLAPASLAQWGRLVEADFAGRPPLAPCNPAASALAVAAQNQERTHP